MVMARVKNWRTAVAFSPDSCWLAAADMDHKVRVWEAATGRCQLTFDGHTNSVMAVAVSPDGRRVASGGVDKTIRVWEAATGRCRFTFGGPSSPLKKAA
jgi:WD40 repeat protein